MTDEDEPTERAPVWRLLVATALGAVLLIFGVVDSTNDTPDEEYLSDLGDFLHLAGGLFVALSAWDWLDRLLADSPVRRLIVSTALGVLLLTTAVLDAINFDRSGGPMFAIQYVLFTAGATFLLLSAWDWLDRLRSHVRTRRWQP